MVCFTNGKLEAVQKDLELTTPRSENSSSGRHHFVNGTLRANHELQVATPKSQGQKRDEATPEKVSLDQASKAKRFMPLEDLVRSRAFVAISLPNCPQCDELGAFLEARGVPSSVFEKWDKSSEEYPDLKASLSKFAGDRFTFPQVFAGGEYQGDFVAVMTKAAQGEYDHIFEDQFGAKPSTVKQLIQKEPMVVLSLTHCPQCDVLRSQLEQRGLPVDSIFIKWDKAKPNYQSLKAQLIELIEQSQFTFPQTFLQSEYQGGFADVTAKVESGEFDAAFEKHFGIAPPAPVAEPANVVMQFDDDF